MRFSSLIRGLVALPMLAACALSAPINITLASSLLPAAPGQTVTFSSTLTNTTALPLFLNGDSLNVAAPLTTNDTKFLSNFPLSLTAGQVFSAPTFDVSVPQNTPFGIYSGEFDVLGGSNANAQATIGTATFAVNVVPEPETFGSAFAGLLGVIVFVRNKRRSILRVILPTHAS